VVLSAVLSARSHCFDVKTAESYRYVDNLFAFYNRQEMRAGEALVRTPPVCRVVWFRRDACVQRWVARWCQPGHAV
jgi:hypothetical protein